jgi:ABC-type nitrate/sulfonate/bicarbonate transport system permease component
VSTQTDRSLRNLVPIAAISNSYVVFIESIVAFVIVWLFFAEGLNLSGTISSPILVATAIAELMVSMEWVEHLWATLRRTIYGFVITMVVGTVLGLVMGMSDFWEEALQDYIIIGLALPALFAAVFAAMWFGVSDTTPMVAGAIISFPFLTQSVYEAAKDIDAGLIQMTRAFDVSRSRMIKRVIVQSVLPAWFGGSRYAFSICWKITTVAELIAASNGIGFMIERQLELRSMTGMLVWTLLFTFVIIVFEYGILQQFEKRVFVWRQEPTISW